MHDFGVPLSVCKVTVGCRSCYNDKDLINTILRDRGEINWRQAFVFNDAIDALISHFKLFSDVHIGRSGHHSPSTKSKTFYDVAWLCFDPGLLFGGILGFLTTLFCKCRNGV